MPDRPVAVPFLRSLHVRHARRQVEDEVALVYLGREVEERVVVDETFATRDLVADLNRTARLRVVTISDRRARLLVGDRHRLVEVASDDWPLVRDDDAGPTLWVRSVA